MKISKKMQDAINIQMKNEYDNAFLYLSIASWFEQKSLKGFAHWNFIQYQEEQEHALKFYNYLLERQGEAIVDAVAKPQKDWNSVIDVFKDILAKEKETTENISIHAVIDKQDVTSSDYNYFPAFQIFRDKLLELGYGIKCNGSRINAIQSGMMGGTDEIYLVEAGKQALMENIVRIWDYTDIDTFPDTKQQLDFLKQWTPY